jgi:transposase-like protein
MRNVVRYSEAFKLRLVEDVADGKYKSLDEAGRRNGIRGSATVARWIKQYGREDILPKRIKVETMDETDEMKAARRRIRELEAGLTPCADCSGLTERYGSIAKSPFCHPIRGIVLEGVWALVRSGNGPLFQKYEELSGRMNKRKSAVAIGRKMVSLAWLLMRRRDYYNGVSSTALEKKLRYYKIKKMVEEAVSA